MMFSPVSFLIIFTIVSFPNASPSKLSSQNTNMNYTDIKSLTMKEAIYILRNFTQQHFKKTILPILMCGTTKIMINRTLAIPFHTAQPISHIFPIFLNNVTIRTNKYTNNSFDRIAKLRVALNRLRKLLRHPSVLQEIAMRNFSIWGRKKFINGQKLIYMFGSVRLTGGFEIIIKSLKQGKTRANW